MGEKDSLATSMAQKQRVFTKFIIVLLCLYACLCMKLYKFYETNFSLGLEDVKVKTVAASSYHSVSLTGRP